MSEPHIASDDPVALHIDAMRKRDVARHNAIIASALKRRMKLFRLGVDPNAKPVTPSAKPDPHETP